MQNNPKQLQFFRADPEKKCALPYYLSPVHAGFPSPADDYIEKKLDLNTFLIKTPEATFYVRVEGDSMQDANINSGDILIVDRSLPPKEGNIIIAIFEGEFTVKRIKTINNTLFLVAENPNYTKIQIFPDSDFSIWGVVTYVIHRTL